MPQPTWGPTQGNVEVDLVLLTLRKDLCPVLLTWHFLWNTHLQLLEKRYFGLHLVQQSLSLLRENRLTKRKWDRRFKQSIAFYRYCQLITAPTHFRSPVNLIRFPVMAWGIKTPLQIRALVFKTPAGKAGCRRKREGEKTAGKEPLSSCGGIDRWTESPTKILVADV